MVAVVPTLGLETRMDYILSLKVDESGFSRKQPYMSGTALTTCDAPVERLSLDRLVGVLPSCLASLMCL